MKTKDKHKFMEVKTKSGLLLVIDELKVGTPVFVRTSVDANTPAPEGEYELEDGTMVIVNSDNLIQDIKPIEAAPVEDVPVDQPVEEVPVEETPTEEVPVTEQPVEEAVITLDERVAKLEQAIADLLANLQLSKDEFSAYKSEVEVKLSESSEHPFTFKQTKEESKPLSVFELRKKVLFGK